MASSRSPPSKPTTTTTTPKYAPFSQPDHDSQVSEVTLGPVFTVSAPTDGYNMLPRMGVHAPPPTALDPVTEEFEEYMATTHGHWVASLITPPGNSQTLARESSIAFRWQTAATTPSADDMASRDVETVHLPVQPAIMAWATAHDAFEYFGVTGQPSRRGYLHAATRMRSWEQTFRQAASCRRP